MTTTAKIRIVQDEIIETVNNKFKKCVDPMFRGLKCSARHIQTVLDGKETSNDVDNISQMIFRRMIYESL